MSSQGDEAAEQGPETVGSALSSSSAETDATSGDFITVTIGATVPTGFEHTAAEEIKEKIGVDARISKDRGRIYFPITTDKLFQVRGDSKLVECPSSPTFCLLLYSIINTEDFALIINDISFAP